MGAPAAGAAASMGIAGGQQAGADPNAAAQAGQASWGAADPNNYYANYWGGYYNQAPAADGQTTQMQGAPQ
jgi:nucleolysin TIA-1/TIAR